MPFTRFLGLLQKAATSSSQKTTFYIPEKPREMPSAGKGSYQWDALTLFQLTEYLKRTETNNSADAAHKTTPLDPKQS